MVSGTTTELRTADVWDALAAIPDPEIPVISLVDLGVISDVRVDGERVEIDFTPTFLGCPALEVMRTAMVVGVRGLGAEPLVRVVTEDGWTTDRITPLGREKLRSAGFAPPGPRPAGGLQLVQLQRGGHRCPYCASTDTRQSPAKQSSRSEMRSRRVSIARPAGRVRRSAQRTRY